MSVEPQESKKLIHQILKAEGVIVLLVGIFFMTKHYYSNFEFLGPDTDSYFGFGLFAIGIANFIIADKFFPYKTRDL